MINFVHTADIHFGVENYGKLDQKTGIHTRLLDFKKALDACVDYAINNNVDFFLIAGDLYKTAHPTPTQQRLLLQSLLRLYAAQIPIVMIVGNHDKPASFGKAHSLEIFSQIPVDGFTVIDKPCMHTLTTKNGPINILGLPWPSKSSLVFKEKLTNHTAHDHNTYISNAINAYIQDQAKKLDPTHPAIIAGHLTVSNGLFSGSERQAITGSDPIFLPSDLAVEPFDYIALGHLHRHQQLNPDKHPAIVYSGSPERIDFGEYKEAKGFCHITIHSKQKTTYTFVPTPTRPCIMISCTLQNTSEKTQTEQILEHIAQHDLSNALVKITYHVPAGQKDMVDLRAVQRACARAFAVAAIIPIHAPSKRTQRTNACVSMTMEELLELYCSLRPELKDKQDMLIKKAQELAAHNEQ